MKILVDVHGDVQVLESLARMTVEKGALADALDAIGMTVADNARMRFSSQTGPNDEQWTESYRAKKEGGKTLLDTGVLRNSITHKLVSDDEVVIFANSEYAHVLQFGATITAKASDYLKFLIPKFGWVTKKSVTIPARPFLGFSNADKAEVLDILEAFLGGAWHE